MGQRRTHFRITKKGRIVFTLLSTTLVLAGAVILWIHPGVVFSSSNPKNSKTHAPVVIKGQDDKTNGSVDINDDLASIIGPYKYVSSTKTNTNTNSSNNGNKNTDPEIDEEFFNKALFIGDSITEGISAYGLLNDKNVLAVKGLTVLKAEKEIDTIAKRNPERIYILLGSNDLLYGMDSEKFSSEYIEFIQHIKDKLPDSKIYIQSIFPVSKDIESKKPMLSNSRIDEFNTRLKSMAKEQKINYINISEFLKDNSGIMNKDYTSDGIHVKYKFYSIWLDCVKRNS